MYGRIIELYTLSYSYRSGTDNYYSLLSSGFYKLSCFVVFLFVVSRIEIRRLRREFRSARVNHFKYSVYVLRKRTAGELFKFSIGITEFFTAQILFGRNLNSGNFLFIIGKIFKFI